MILDFIFLLSFANIVFAIDTLYCGLSSREQGGLLPEFQCPGYFLEMYYVTNTTYNFSNITSYFSEINGTMGYCGTPIAQNGQLLTTSETMTFKHHVEIIIPIPWCFSAILFSGKCSIIAGGINPAYPDYFGPAVLYNERPLQTKCRNIYGQSSNITFFPNNIPLWDNSFTNQNTIGTVRVAINDSCIFNSTFSRSMIAFDIILQNGFETYPNGSGLAPEFLNSTLNNTNSHGKYFYGAYGETTTGSDTGTWCNNFCDTFITQTCSDNRTTSKKETFRPRSVVSLACKDIVNGFGFVWRVENIVSTNMHFDWFLFDQIQGNFQLPVATNVSVINSSLWNTTSRNIGFNDPLFNGFWLGVAGKRRIAGGNYFYIPTYMPNSTVTPTSFSRDNLLRPTIIDLYAGYPHHYVGSTILAGIVDFFDMKTVLNMSAFIDFNVSGSSLITSSKNVTYIDKNITTTIRFDTSIIDFYIPKDFVRQVIIAVCTKATNVTLTITEIINITHVNGWQNLCNHITNNSKTWSETLSMLYISFPGILLSPSSDPIPICNCSQISRSPCGSNITGLPNMMKSYFPPVSSLVVNASVLPICKINQTFVDLIYKTIAGKGSVIFIYNATKISGSDYGYIWGIENLNINSSIQQPGLTSEHVTTANDLYVKWAFGTFSPPSGIANSTYPLPYPLPNGLEYFTDYNGTVTSYTTHDTSIRSGTRRYFFSLTSSPHKMYGTFQQLCTSSCTNSTPHDPPLIQNPYGWSYGFNASYLASLPDCICSVNVPCNYGEFVFTVDINANLSSFVAVAPDPLPPLNYATISQECIPTVEECNGIDDNCDGIIDNIHGYGSICDYIPSLNGTGVCISGNLGCPPYSQMIPSYINFTSNPELKSVYKSITYKSICHGSIISSEEICNLLDDDCDGIVDNIPTKKCGSNVLGVCRLGVYECDNLGNTICVGEILPIPEICGDDLDNDCDGEIDNGCPSAHNGINVIGYSENNNHEGTRNAFSIMFSNKVSTKNQISTQNNVDSSFKTLTNDLLSDISNTIDSIYSTLILYFTIIFVTLIFVILLCVTGNFGACSTLCGFLPTSPWISLYGNQDQNSQIDSTNDDGTTELETNKQNNSTRNRKKNVFMD